MGKGALETMTRTLASALGTRGITGQVLDASGGLHLGSRAGLDFSPGSDPAVAETVRSTP